MSPAPASPPHAAMVGAFLGGAMALGTGLGMVVAQWVADGTITGSAPRDRGRADLMRADGWQPYSIRIGDTYYSYQRLDPLAMTLGTPAGVAAVGARAAGTNLAADGAGP